MSTATQKHLLIIRRLAFAAVIYQVWKARNLAAFENRVFTAKEIVAEVLQSVRNVIAGWKGIPRTKQNWEMAGELSLSHDCFSI